eukprot:scaffold35363_cov56-Phaeocystis_antarctica.AAC.4
MNMRSASMVLSCSCRMSVCFRVLASEPPAWKRSMMVNCDSNRSCETRAKSHAVTTLASEQPTLKRAEPGL